MGEKYMKFDITSELFWSHFISNYTNYLISAMLFVSISQCKTSKTRRVILLVAGVALSVVSICIMTFNSELAHAFYYLSVVLLLLVLTNSFQNHAVGICLISISGALATEIVVSLLVSVICFFLPVLRNLVLLWAIIGVVQLALTYALLHIKRFKNSLGFFRDESRLGIGVVFAGIAFIIDCIDFRNSNSGDLFLLIIVIGFLMVGIGIYFWIRRSITLYYRERLQLKTEEHYQKLLTESEDKSKKLLQSNEYLAKIVHRDNHIMSSLNTAVDAYFQTNDDQFKEEILKELQTLARERGELMEQEQRELKILPSTGNLLIDGAIKDLYIKASAHGIDFELSVSEPLDAIIGKYISQTDLQTLLCDHIKDAIIAVNAKNEENGKILVALSARNGNYEIGIFDSGAEFETETFSKLGLERTTTHAADGGSGIGFMTTFATLKKSRASLIITEFENQSPFSKSITFLFDGEGRFAIQSYRSDEIRNALDRTDIIIL